MEEKIKPIYAQLMGILSQTPSFSSSSTTISTVEIWENYNKVIDKLNNISGKSYDDFKVVPKYRTTSSFPGSYVNGTFYRQQVNGLIMQLYGEYFSTENAPFSSSPGIILSQNQQQNQSVQITIALDVQSLIDKQLYTGNLKEEEKSFLERLKQTLPTIKSATDLLNAVITTARSSGLTIEQVKQILGF